MDDTQIEQRRARQDATWSGPRYTGLLFVTLAIALAVIYTIASIRTGDFSWNPIANQPARDLPPSGW